MKLENRFCDTCQRYWTQPRGQRRFERCPRCRAGRYSAGQSGRWSRHRLDVEAKAWAARQPAGPRPDLDALAADVATKGDSALKAADTAQAFLRSRTG
jgi:hypothetical protein